jgi:hypothetical protein
VTCPHRLTRLDPRRKYPDPPAGGLSPYCYTCWWADRQALMTGPAVARGPRTPPARSVRPPAAATPRAVPLPLVVPPPCSHLGPVVEPCKTCGGKKAELRNVHLCNHDAADWDKCVRGPSRVPEVKSCQSCPLYDTVATNRPS